MPYMSITNLAEWLHLSPNRTYMLTRQKWFPRTIFLGRIVMEEAQVKAALRKRFYHPPEPEAPSVKHTHLCSVEEAAEAFDRSVVTIRRLIRRRRLGAYHLGKILIPIEEIQRLRPLFQAFAKYSPTSEASAGAHD